MSKKNIKKIQKKSFINPRTPAILKWMQGKVPVTCPSCKIELLRNPKILEERCNNCLKDVVYKVINS